VLSGQAGHTKKNDAGGSRRVTRKKKKKKPFSMQHLALT